MALRMEYATDSGTHTLADLRDLVNETSDWNANTIVKVERVPSGKSYAADSSKLKVLKGHEAQRASTDPRDNAASYYSNGEH